MAKSQVQRLVMEQVAMQVAMEPVAGLVVLPMVLGLAREQEPGLEVHRHTKWERKKEGRRRLARRWLARRWLSSLPRAIQCSVQIASVTKKEHLGCERRTAS